MMKKKKVVKKINKKAIKKAAKPVDTEKLGRNPFQTSAEKNSDGVIPGLFQKTESSKDCLLIKALEFTLAKLKAL